MLQGIQRFALTCLVAASAVATPSTWAQTEVPFITTPDNVTLEMLKIANVGPSDQVIDLGSGDGRIVITAAKRFGATGLGVEIVPDLVQQSIRNAREAGVADRASFRVQDLFTTDLSLATVITMYLLPEVNMQLRPSILALKPGTRIVSHDWDMGDWAPDRTVTVAVPDKKVGLEKSSKVHLWIVPAKVDGLWCGEGRLAGASLELKQHYQAFEGTLMYRKRSRDLTGRIDGITLRSMTLRAGELILQAVDGRLRISAAGGPIALARGGTFVHAPAGGCS